MIHEPCSLQDMKESESLPAKQKAVWSPKALAVFGLLFSIIPAGIMFSINYGRYGRRKQQVMWLCILVVIFASLIAGDIAAPDWSFHRWLLVSVPTLWILYLKQVPLYRQWMAHGGKKASLWSGLLICCAFLVVVLGINAVVYAMTPDPYAYDLLTDRQYAKAERVLIDSRNLYPEDLDVRYNLAIVYASTSRPDLARKELLAILAAKPNRTDAREFLAELEEAKEAIENDVSDQAGGAHP